jgi:hypothetical protein
MEPIAMPNRPLSLLVAVRGLVFAALALTATPGCRTTSDGSDAAGTDAASVGTCDLGPVRLSAGDRLPSIDGCNTCQCQQLDGKTSIACTEVACSDAPRVKGCRIGGLAVMPSGSKMTAVDGCNACTCTSGGTVSCTNEPCSSAPAVADADPPLPDDDDAPIKVPVAHCEIGGVKIKSGATLPASDGCNKCTCGDFGDGIGMFSCTELACPKHEDPDGCDLDGLVMMEDDETLPAVDGCNTCTCGEDGVVCTKRECEPPPAGERKARCEIGPIQVAPGVTLPSADGCNSCRCEDLGSGNAGLACTELACPGMIEPNGCEVSGLVVLKPGASFKAVDGCNTCKCEADGTVSCTELACTPGGQE